MHGKKINAKFMTEEKYNSILNRLEESELIQNFLGKSEWPENMPGRLEELA